MTQALISQTTTNTRTIIERMDQQANHTQREMMEALQALIPAEDHWGGIALFVAEQMPSIAWSSHATTEALVDAMGQYIKDRSAREEARRERREKEVQ
jgi:hypothetical protein